MDSMTNGNRRFNNAGINAAAALLSVAVAILISYAANNWWLFVPVILLEAGMFVLVLGLSLGRPRPGMPWTRSDSNYYLFWGNLSAAIGALLILNTVISGIAVILFVIFLIWMAAFALLFSIRRKRP
jgi:hypothetical protein